MEKELLEIRQELLDTNPVELAQDLEELEIQDIVDILYLIEVEHSAEVFPYFSIDKKEELILKLNQNFVYDLIENLYTDDIKEILDNENEEVVNRILDLASPSRKLQLNLQLKFDEYSAGSLMSVDFVKISDEDNVLIAMKKIKSQEKIAETISYCYVVNEYSTLIGCISMKDILLAPDDMLIKDLMESDIITVNVDDDQEEVTQVFSKYDLLAVPVVDDMHHILGIITIDDVLDIIEEEVTEDIQRMNAINPTEGNYLDLSTFEMSKSRIVWLLILMISATVSGSIIAANKDITILSSVLIFMPMILDTAGNAGCQSSAMVIRGIVVDNMTISNIWDILKKELLSSAILGAILFVINTLRIIILMPSVGFVTAFVVSLTILIIVTIANIIGGLLPIMGHYFKIDPASMSGPVLTTACDAISLLTYFGLIRLFHMGGLI